MFDQSRGKIKAVVAASVLAMTLGSASAPARADHGADIVGPMIAFLALGTILQHGHQHKHYRYYKRYRHHGHHGYYGHRRHHGYDKHHRRHSHSHGDYYAYKRKHRKHWDH